MTSDEFRTYLRDLQKDPYNHPNDYFAWEKPDKTLFMIGTKSHFLHDIMKYEFDPFFKEYGVHFCSLDPNETHLLSGAVPYDPVEHLTKEVSGYRFLGSWRDPEALMEHSEGTGKVLACGRWELAREHILASERKPSLDYQIGVAQEVLSATSFSAPDRAGERQLR